MNRETLRRITLGALALPLAIGLAACGEEATGTGQLSGEPIENVAPPQGQTWSSVIEKTPEGGYRMGNPDAPIKLIEFASLTCPHCASFSQNSSPELKQDFIDSGRVSLEFRNFIMNPIDLSMAMMVRCGADDSFFALTEQTFANQPAILQAWTDAGEAAASQAAQQPPAQRFRAIAEVAGLPDFYAARGIATEQAEACLADSGNAEKLVEMTEQQSNEYDVTGTPTFLINGSKVDANTWPKVKAELERLGAR